MKDSLKKMLGITCELFNLVDEKTGIMARAGAKGQLCNILKFELVSFLSCLSACDGRISRAEAQVIREYFELNLNPQQIRELVRENQVGTAAYYEKVPECLRLALAVDNSMIAKGYLADKGLGEIVIELFKVFGKEMVIADERVTAEEQVSWSRNITMMTRCLAAHSAPYRRKTESVVARPGTPIEVDYEMSLNKIGRIYTLYVGRL